MELKCEMNRLDWLGNPGAAIRRGEIFEIDDPKRITTWLKAGYVTDNLEEPEDLEEEEEEVGPDPDEEEEEEESEVLESPKMLGSED